MGSSAFCGPCFITNKISVSYRGLQCAGWLDSLHCSGFPSSTLLSPHTVPQVSPHCSQTCSCARTNASSFCPKGSFPRCKARPFTSFKILQKLMSPTMRSAVSILFRIVMQFLAPRAFQTLYPAVFHLSSCHLPARRKICLSVMFIAHCREYKLLEGRHCCLFF